MTYFKHMTKMRHDPKIRRIIARYGIEGYGLYCLILESIVGNITTESPLPHLEETCEDIAEMYNGNTAKINEIMSFMINQGLFELDDITACVTCNKIYKYLEQSGTGSAQIRGLIKAFRDRENGGEITGDHDAITKHHDTSRKNVNRTEQNRTEQKKKIEYVPADADTAPTAKPVRFTRPTLEQIRAYCLERKNAVNPQRFLDYYEANGWRVGKAPMKDWKAAVRTWESNQATGSGKAPKVMSQGTQLDMEEA